MSEQEKIFYTYSGSYCHNIYTVLEKVKVNILDFLLNCPTISTTMTLSRNDAVESAIDFLHSKFSNFLSSAKIHSKTLFFWSVELCTRPRTKLLLNQLAVTSSVH